MTKPGIAKLISGAVISGFVALPTYAQTTIIQSNSGIGCSSVCINGKCTSSCNGEVSESSDALVGNGEIKEKNLALKDFNSVLTSGVETIIRQGEVWEVKLVADSNLLDSIIVEKKDTGLNVSLKNGEYHNATLTIEITMPDLRGISQQGADRVTFSGFDQASLDINAHGSGELLGNDNIVTNLTMGMTGSGMIDLKGTEITNANLTIDGAGDVKLNFKEASKKGDATLAGSIAGVGEVQYCGNPENSLDVFGVADFVQVECL